LFTEIPHGVWVEQRPTPADRHTFHQSSGLASAASRFKPLVLIRFDVIRWNVGRDVGMI
jgi:hypothetical protein